MYLPVRPTLQRATAEFIGLIPTMREGAGVDEVEEEVRPRAPHAEDEGDVGGSERGLLGCSLSAVHAGSITRWSLTCNFLAGLVADIVLRGFQRPIQIPESMFPW